MINRAQETSRPGKKQHRVAIYARYSDDAQRRTSIDDQVKRCRDLLNTLRLPVQKIDIYKDEALSAKSRDLHKREGLLRLLEHWRSGHFDTVVVDEYSRLVRHRALHNEIMDLLEEKNVFLLTSDGMDSRQRGWELHLDIKGVLAATESRFIAFRVQRGMKGQLERGFMIATPAYGYSSIREDVEGGGTQWVIVDDQAAVVREIFERRAEGSTFAQIAKSLNDRCVAVPRSTKRGANFWRASTISRMLQNAIYKGEFHWHGSAAYKAKCAKKDKDPEIRVYARPELRIVSDELWEACNSNRFSRTRYGGGRHAFAGLVHCHACDAVLVVNSNKSSPALYCASCDQGRRVGIDQGGRGYLSVNALRQVLATAVADLFSGEFVKTFRARLRERLLIGNKVAIDKLRRQLEMERRASERLAGAIGYGGDSLELLMRQMKVVEGKMESIGTELRKLEVLEASVDPKAIETQIAVNPKHLLGWLFSEELPPERLRSLLGRLFDRVIYLGKPAKHLADISVTLSPGEFAAMATSTEVIDHETVDMRYRVALVSRQPSVWEAVKIKANCESTSKGIARSTSVA